VCAMPIEMILRRERRWKVWIEPWFGSHPRQVASVRTVEGLPEGAFGMPQCHNWRRLRVRCRGGESG